MYAVNLQPRGMSGLKRVRDQQYCYTQQTQPITPVKSAVSNSQPLQPSPQDITAASFLYNEVENDRCQERLRQMNQSQSQPQQYLQQQLQQQQTSAVPSRTSIREFNSGISHPSSQARPNPNTGTNPTSGIKLIDLPKQLSLELDAMTGLLATVEGRVRACLAAPAPSAQPSWQDIVFTQHLLFQCPDIEKAISSLPPGLLSHVVQGSVAQNLRSGKHINLQASIKIVLNVTSRSSSSCTIIQGDPSASLLQDLQIASSGMQGQFEICTDVITIADRLLEACFVIITPRTSLAAQTVEGANAWHAWLEGLCEIFKGASMRRSSLPEQSTLVTLRCLSKICSPPSSYLPKCISVQEARNLFQKPSDDPSTPPEVATALGSVFSFYIDAFTQDQIGGALA